MIASLGMYDLPELHAANDAYWSAIRAELGHGPARLTRCDDLWALWQSSELLLAQTCGYPYRARLHGTVELVGTPDPGLPDCPPGHYRSVLVVRVDDPRTALAAFDGARFAYNDALSQSGWAGPVRHLLDHELRPGPLLETGGHALSAEAVAHGHAELAGIDALTWELLRSHRRALTDRLRVLDRTAPAPALPYITAKGGNAPALFDAITRAIAGLELKTRAALHINGIVAIPPEQYLAVPTPPAPGEA